MIQMTKHGNYSNVATEEWIIDTKKEKDQVTGSIPFGSTLYIIETKETFILDGNNVWQPM